MEEENEINDNIKEEIKNENNDELRLNDTFLSINDPSLKNVNNCRLSKQTKQTYGFYGFEQAFYFCDRIKINNHNADEPHDKSPNFGQKTERHQDKIYQTAKHKKMKIKQE